MKPESYKLGRRNEADLNRLLTCCVQLCECVNTNAESVNAISKTDGLADILFVHTKDLLLIAHGFSNLIALLGMHFHWYEKLHE